MSNILLPSIDNNISKSVSKVSNKIKKNNLTVGTKSFRTYLYENNLKNFLKQNSFKDTQTNKSVKPDKNKITNLKKFYNDNKKPNNKNDIKLFLKNKTYLDLENNKTINKNLNLLLINKSYNSLNIGNIFNSSKSNKNYNNFSINYSDEYNKTENNSKYITTDIFKDRNNINDSNNLYKNQDKKSSRELKVNQIVDSLINSPNKENKKQNICLRIKFPKEKSVDPFSYIRYNLQNAPYDQTFYKGIKEIITKIRKGPLRKEYKNNLIQKATDVNNLKVESKHFEAPLGEAKIYQKKFDDMMNQTKIYKSFYFNKNTYSQNKKKINYNPQRNILDKTYKIYFDKKFKIKENIIDDNNKNKKNNTKIDMKLEKNIDKYLSFDSRINNMLFISKNTEDDIIRKSKEHEEMLNKFNFLFKSYNK